MIRERRTTLRVNFGAVAEVFALGSPRQLIALTRDLSLGGCFVKTQDVFPPGTEVKVRITSSGKEFSAIGRVTGNINIQGMGIQFVEIDSHNQAVIENWLDLKK